MFDLHAAGAIGTFDSAVIRKEDDGKVRVTKTEKPTQHGAWTGAGVGALVGILFPPAVLGAGPGAVLGRLLGLGHPDLAVVFLADRRRVEGSDRAGGVEALRRRRSS